MKKILFFIKSHKVISISVASALTLAIVGGVGFGLYQAKYGATNLAAKYAAKGYITPEEMEEIEASGDLVLGEEIADAEGNIIVLEKDANGNIISHVVGRQEGQQGSSEPGHSHIWTAHYSTRSVTEQVFVPAVKQPVKVCMWECDCGATGEGTEWTTHQKTSHCGGKSGGLFYITKYVEVSPDHYETQTRTEQYIDYYYCSECGARQ